MRNTLYILAGALLFAFATSVFITADQQAGQKDWQFDQAPDFSLENYAGEILSLEEIDTPITVVNIWASWCPFCTDELPDFTQLQKAFPEKITVVAINRGESRETAKNFTDQAGISEDLTFLLDPDGSYYQKIGGFAMPETLFLNADKEIVRHHRGPLSFGQMEELINVQLKEVNYGA